ncbi:IS1595 family transposase, partial [Photorhabdus africana]
TVWFLAIYLMTQEKNGISALELSRQLGISYNAAWRMKHKLMKAMKERDDEKPLGGFIQLDDAYWGGAQHGPRGR